MQNKLVTTSWNTSFDDEPTSNIPRIRFSEKFSESYLDGKNLILEIGCGTGSYTKLIDRKGCLGLDLDFNALRVARKYCTNSDFVLASALNLPFRKEIFDLIFMWGVLEEIPQETEKQMMLDAHRTLISNSFLLLSVGNAHIISNTLNPAFIFHKVRHYNLQQILKLLYACGFTLKEYTIRGSLNTLIANFLFYFYKHVIKKKRGSIKAFFDKKSAIEIFANRDGIVYIYIAAQK